MKVVRQGNTLFYDYIIHHGNCYDAWSLPESYDKNICELVYGMRERIMSWMHKISSSFENDEKSPCCWLKAKNTYSSLLQKHSLDCEQHTDCVNTCVNWDGTEVFSYKIPNEEGHRKIVIDRNGHVYSVVCREFMQWFQRRRHNAYTNNIIFIYLFNRFNPPPLLRLDCHRQLSWSYFGLQWVKVRRGCSFCSCGWNVWPLLFKLSFHNNNCNCVDIKQTEIKIQMFWFMQIIMEILPIDSKNTLIYLNSLLKKTKAQIPNP